VTGGADLTRRWGGYFPQHDLDVLDAAGYGKRMGFGTSPALLVVDVTYGFCGEGPMPILEAVRENRRACGERAWSKMETMARVLDAAREAAIPVVFSAMRDPESSAFEAGLWGAKNHRTGETSAPGMAGGRANRVVDELRPRPTEMVVSKDKPSVFHGTGLLPYLIGQGVDSLLMYGGTTSGCVYATAVDAFSYNYRTSVIADATFDRVDASHWASLLDIDMKYGDVVDSAEVLRYLARSTDRRMTSAEPS
jgi:maleamate amidohydrolase